MAIALACEAFMVAVSEKLNEIQRKLSAVTEVSQSESRQILAHILGCSHLDLIFKANQMLTKEEIEKIDLVVESRLSRMPLQYCLGIQNFYGVDFKVTPSVLIPRPETEVLVSYIEDYARGKSGKLLDVGTGSGAIVITLNRRLPSFECAGLDISAEALEVAKENERLCPNTRPIRWILSDLFEGIIETETFDIIVSNPPYIPNQDKLEPEVFEHEPHLALFGGLDGLDFYRQIIPKAWHHLSEQGLLIFEAGHDQYEAIESLLKQHHYSNIGHFNDLNHIPRFIYGRKQTLEVKNHV